MVNFNRELYFEAIEKALPPGYTREIQMIDVVNQREVTIEVTKALDENYKDMIIAHDTETGRVEGLDMIKDQSRYITFGEVDLKPEFTGWDPMEAMEREYIDWPGGAELALKELNEQDKIADQQKLLTEKFMFERDIKHLSTDNLKVLAQAFAERLDEDPSFEWKRDICEEILEKKLEREIEFDR